MKGNKAYQEAKRLFQEMYEKISLLDDQEREHIYSQYLEFLRQAAYLGHSDAQNELAMQYEEGTF